MNGAEGTRNGFNMRTLHEDVSVLQRQIEVSEVMQGYMQVLLNLDMEPSAEVDCKMQLTMISKFVVLHVHTVHTVVSGILPPNSAMSDNCERALLSSLRICFPKSPVSLTLSTHFLMVVIFFSFLFCPSIFFFYWHPLQSS